MGADTVQGADMSEQLEQEVAALRHEIARLNAHRFVRIHNTPMRLLAFNFARGLAFGLGTVLGASLLLSIAAWALAQIDFIPVIGEWAAIIAREIEAVTSSQN